MDSQPPVVIATFYHFTALPDAAALQPQWKAQLVAHGVTGTILVTPEGVNATIVGSRAGVSAILALLRADARLATMPHKESYADNNPFQRAKVKLKRETIPLGVTVDATMPGIYVKPADWNALIARPETIVIDTRNAYETAIGTFKHARDPATRTFRDLPAWLRSNLPPEKSTPIAMYCTGGIRCEKSTAYLRGQGYTNVYHLEGGILKYLEEIPAEHSLWHGACYVFDDRVAVEHDLSPATRYQNCPTCNTPVVAGEFKRMHGRNGCQHCTARTTLTGRT